MSACSWVTLAGAHLVCLHTVETFGLPLTSYTTEDWIKKDGSGLCREIADSVAAKKKGIRRRLSSASTVGQVNGSAALLLCMYCSTRVKDATRVEECGNKGNLHKLDTP